MAKEPNIFIRVWLCLSAPKRWRKRLIIDKAGVYLMNNFQNKEEEEIAHKLHTLSDRLWDEEFSRHI